MRRLLVVALVAASPVGCVGNAGAPGVVRTDSAGVTIVTNSREAIAAAPRWTLAPEPVLSIESPEDGDYTLFRVGDVAPLSGGRLAVANAGSNEVYVFDGDGTLAFRFGRKGDGPGEFQRIVSLVALLGDSVAVFDAAHRRLSVFDSAGTLCREVSLADVMTVAGAPYEAVVRPLPGGDLVLATKPGFGPHGGEGVYRSQSEWLRLNPAGRQIASYGMVLGAQMFITGHAAGAPMFGAITYVATAGDALVVGTGESTEVRVHEPDGRLSLIIRWPDHDRTVTQARIDGWLTARASQLPEAQRAAARSVMQELPHAAREPPYQDIIGAADGHVWVGNYRDPTTAAYWTARPPARHWLVFALDGSLAATVDTPAGFTPRLVRGERVIGVYRDELDVESVRAYQMSGT